MLYEKQNGIRLPRTSYIKAKVGANEIENTLFNTKTLQKNCLLNSNEVLSTFSVLGLIA